MRFVRQFHVQRSPEDVYGYLLDVEHEADWNPWAIEVHKSTPGPAGEGTEFVGRYRRIGTARQRLTDCEPARRLTYRADTMDGRMTFTLEPKNDGTTVELAAEAHPAGVQRLFATGDDAGDAPAHRRPGRWHHARAHAPVTPARPVSGQMWRGSPTASPR